MQLLSLQWKKKGKQTIEEKEREKEREREREKEKERERTKGERGNV